VLAKISAKIALLIIDEAHWRFQIGDMIFDRIPSDRTYLAQFASQHALARPERDCKQPGYGRSGKSFGTKSCCIEGDLNRPVTPA